MHNKRWPFWLSIGIIFFVFIYFIRGILLPFVLGTFIAYFLHPLTDKLERSGTRRGVATLMVLAAFFLTLLLIFALLAPAVTQQLSSLIASLPDYVNQYQETYAPQLSQWLGDLPVEASKGIKSATSNISGDIVKFVEQFLTGIFHSGMAFVHLLSLILITPIVAFYLLRDWNAMVARIDQLLPRDHASTIRKQLTIIDRTLGGFLRGQINICLMMAVFYSIALSVAGLNFAIIIGTLTGFLTIFPFIGLALGTIIGTGVALFQFSDYSQTGVVLAIFIIGGAIEGYGITPRLVGQRVGLHPVWIIFGMLAGGALFGLTGVLLAVPATAVIGVLLRFAIERYVQSDYYQGQQAKLHLPVD